jgi:hypothetical protein
MANGECYGEVEQYRQKEERGKREELKVSPRLRNYENKKAILK